MAACPRSSSVCALRYLPVATRPLCRAYSLALSARAELPRHLPWPPRSSMDPCSTATPRGSPSIAASLLHRDAALLRCKTRHRPQGQRISPSAGPPAHLRCRDPPAAELPRAGGGEGRARGRRRSCLAGPLQLGGGRERGSGGPHGGGAMSELCSTRLVVDPAPVEGVARGGADGRLTGGWVKEGDTGGGARLRRDEQRRRAEGARPPRPIEGWH